MFVGNSIRLGEVGEFERGSAGIRFFRPYDTLRPQVVGSTDKIYEIPPAAPLVVLPLIRIEEIPIEGIADEFIVKTE